MSKYNIGKRPLSLLLDWGELTITRYLKGMVPKKDYLDLLKAINEDANKFYEMLQKNQTKITKVAYEKCRSNLDKIGIKDSNVDLDLEQNSDLDYQDDLAHQDNSDYQNDLDYLDNFDYQDEVEQSKYVRPFDSGEKNDKIFKVGDYI